MEQFYIDTIDQAVSLHKKGDLKEAEHIYNRVLNVFPEDEQVLFLLGDLYLRKGHNGLAISVLRNLLRLNENHSYAWCNLGVAYRKENHNEKAEGAWMRAISNGGETYEVCNNMASLHSDTGDPKKAIYWCDKALELSHENPNVLWQKSLALLSLKEYKKGFTLYEYRQDMDNWHSRKEIETPIWDGSPVENLYVHGEQGVGDEVMFLSQFKHIADRCDNITLELNGKVVGLAKNLREWDTHGEHRLNIVSDVKEVGENEKFDAKLPLGSVFELFGLPDGEPYIYPRQMRYEFYRAELEKLGPGPYVAICWLGGTKQTRVVERSVPLKALNPLMEKYTCVSAQYSAGNPGIEEERLANGLPKINDECCDTDLAEQAALFSAVDAVVTVQQTAVHVAGAVGAKTFVMVAERPQWRYGLEGDTVPWYNSVKLFRKAKKKDGDTKEEDWTRVINKIEGELDAYFSNL